MADFTRLSLLNVRGPAIKVTVTKEKIERARKCDGYRCMIAEALMEAYPEGSYILVDLQFIRVSNMVKGERYFYATPRKAQAPLLAFDRGEVVKPFSFWINDPQVKPTGWLSQRSKGSRRGGGGGPAPARRGITNAPKSYTPRSVRRMFGLCQLPANQ